MGPSYTIDYCDQYIDELCDKMGSDLFTIPVKEKRFYAMTYDFLRENTGFIEVTQEISDDIKPMLVKAQVNLTVDPDDAQAYLVAEPADYFRLIQLIPLYLDGTLKQKAKKVNIIRMGQEQAYERDVFRKPTPAYPTVKRYDNVFEIKVGADNVVYTKANISYVRKPVFGDWTTPVLTDRAVDLPDIAIERICQKVAESLRFTTGDETSMPVYQFDQTFGKRNK